jgi:ligand-binding SRPBCC domain-containing protein
MIAVGKKYHFEKSIVINAPVEKVWQNVNSMKAVNSWIFGL